MKRRFVITLIGCGIVSALWPRRARSTEKVFRIAFVVPTGQFVDAKEGDAWKGPVVAFLQGMRELGYVDGKNMKFDFYSADGKLGRIDEIAARVLETSPDVILAGGGGANEVAHAFQRSTRTVPVVMANSSDPATQGLVASLARPGGNITGFSGNTGPEFEASRLQLLTEVAPNASRAAYLGLKLDWESPAAIGVRNAAQRLGITLLHAEHTPTNYDDAFGLIARERLQGLFVARNPWNFSNRRAITGFAAGQRMAAVYPTREFAEVTGLISYGPSLFDLYRRAAGHVDKILKGARPAELPVEQPTKFELVVHLKTARTLELTIPPSLIAVADDVID
ncbi:ABC transporter substrate-binding protein [Bradyrhizobium lablabi]|uniref:ABC transporter substrate-binding protein n=1 Tax=Bradyrhizobium lablabi TaxID=722472 RepID=UPI001BA9F1A6|nr:ABC transporter substrate-binding protein [Bradyrhizobium lablabi]MBR0694252.1 ABC transporter substrate-binding protein [Bradyrhizobium lablabi]